MSHSLPYLTLTTSTSSLSPNSSIFPTISPTYTTPLAHDPYLPCEVPRQSSGSTQIPSLTQIDISHNARTQNQVSQPGYVRSVDDDIQAAKDTLVEMEKQSGEKLGIPLKPKCERQRLGNQLDPQLQEYLVWPSTKWTEYFTKESEPPTTSSSSQWSSTSWWRPHSWSSTWQGWHQHNWKKDDQWSDQR